mgnify:CR=1 FL=1
MTAHAHRNELRCRLVEHQIAELDRRLRRRVPPRTRQEGWEAQLIRFRLAGLRRRLRRLQPAPGPWATYLHGHARHRPPRGPQIGDTPARERQVQGEWSG